MEYCKTEVYAFDSCNRDAEPPSQRSCVVTQNLPACGTDSQQTVFTTFDNTTILSVPYPIQSTFPLSLHTLQWVTHCTSCLGYNRSSMNALEGLASAQVQDVEAALTRARSRAQFRHVLGRTTIRQNLDISYKQKVKCKSTM